ncbi:prephenate dehydrogenase [Vampirovibrio sp.]|uniref:prephenate dehydrogenase n=1 Tax=Vampirovibrio sp. TaxID=2717857 RepID=UPI003593434A
METMPTLPFERLTVIGLGLIGGSMAMAAKERFPHWQVCGIDPQSESLQFALRHHIIDQAALTLPEHFEDNQLIVIACHVTPALEVLRQLAPCIQGRNIWVTDIGSCKQKIGALGQTLLPTQFLAGHPMAGKEFSGITHATPLLFAGKSYLLCPHEQSDPQLLANLQTFVRALGAHPKLIDAETHDRYMAYVSHLPQLYAVMLTQLLDRNEPGRLMAYHGAGLDDQLRLAASPYPMWGDILYQNAEHLETALLGLRAVIDEALPLLREGNAEGLKVWFDRANEMHGQFLGLQANRSGLPLL